MVSDSFKDYFSTKSDAYANYRPVYPRRLAQALADLCADTETVMDCGCGTGQLSVLLSEFFTQVIATDASSEQIANAKRCDGVTYRVAAAENTQQAAASVNLITVAQAAHWLDLDKFYAETARVLKPGGLLALITYGVIHIDSPECDRIAQDFYYKTLGTYWPPERKHVESGYRTLPFPFEEIQFPPLNMEEHWSFDQLFGYITTWSAFKAFETARQSDEIQRFKNALLNVWGSADIKRTITWPLSVRVGRVK